MSRRCLAGLAGILLVAVTMLIPSPGSSQDVAPSQYPDSRIHDLLETISPEALIQTVQALESFETRDSRSGLDDPDRGMGAARDWILQEFRGYSPRLQVEFDSYRVAPQGRLLSEIDLRNVVAILPGRSARRIYVTGHFDSSARLPGQEEWDRSQTEFDHPAPGANDNGSGTAVTMELARVFAQSGIEFDATLVFVAFAGEEQGLVGAILHAERARQENLEISAVYNSDIVGNERGGDGIVDGTRVRVFSEGPEDSESRQLARYIRRTAAKYVPGHSVELVARADRFGRGGDHSAFSWAGFPAVRFTEPREDYSRQHTIEDTSEGLSGEFMARNARVKASAVASQALAPPSPRVDGPDGLPMLSRHPRRGYDAHLRWEPSPGAVGYRILWRSTWSMDWEFELEVGAVDEVILPGFSIDVHVLGVAAIGREGHESVPSAYVRPPRVIEPIRTIP